MVLPRFTPRAATGLVAAALVLAACGPDTTDETTDETTDDTAENDDGSTPAGGSTPDDGSTPAGGSFAVEQIESSPRAVSASGLQAWQSGIVPDTIPEPLVELDAIRSGGPPPDGIPPIDEPRFENATDVDFLADNEPVLALEIDGDARAYPVQILTWHEIVNDTVGDLPVSVSYCPLCNSAVAYDRRVDEQILDFGTSGLLWNSALVMYDRQTETLWSHFTGEGVVGELTGVQLDDYPLTTVAWSVWRDANPDGLVLSRDTGFERDYGRNPYPGYDDVDGVPFLFDGDVDGRFTAMTRIVGIELDGAAVGVPLTVLQEQRVVATSVGTTPVVVWWTPGTASALDTSAIEAGSDVGTTATLVPIADDVELTFTSGDDDATFVDDQTGSTWNVLGEAIDGPLAGTRLEAVSHVDTFWFAWSTFRSDTEVVTS